MKCQFNGLYETPCPYIKNIKVGAINCVGLKSINRKPCIYFLSKSTEIVIVNGHQYEVSSAVTCFLESSNAYTDKNGQVTMNF